MPKRTAIVSFGSLSPLIDALRPTVNLRTFDMKLPSINTLLELIYLPPFFETKEEPEILKDNKCRLYAHTATATFFNSTHPRGPAISMARFVNRDINQHRAFPPPPLVPELGKYPQCVNFPDNWASFELYGIKTENPAQVMDGHCCPRTHGKEIPFACLFAEWHWRFE
jgi:hypothetical protein